MIRALVISQVIPQWYADVLSNSFESDTDILFITGSEIEAKNIVQSPKYESNSIKSRIKSWIRHFSFVKKWAKKNKDKKFDIIIASSNPPINSFLGLKLKKIFKSPFIYVNWDIYPEVLNKTMHNVFVSIVCFFGKNGIMLTIIR